MSIGDYADQSETETAAGARSTMYPPMPPGYGADPSQGYGQPVGFGYAYGPRWGGFRRYPRPFPGRASAETKPFYLTSEFLVGLIAVVALLITVASSADIGARFFWIWTSVIVSAYMISRGIAKSGTRSRSYDPRDDLSQPTRGGSPEERPHPAGHTQGGGLPL